MGCKNKVESERRRNEREGPGGLVYEDRGRADWAGQDLVLDCPR